MVIMVVRPLEAIRALYGKLGRERESILRAEGVCVCVCVRRLDVCVCDYVFAACSCLMKHRCLLTTREENIFARLAFKSSISPF